MSLTIMGIDPGTVNTGYGVIQLTDQGIHCLDYGVIFSKNKNFGLRIQSIHKEIKKLFFLHKPQHLAIEKVFFGKNADTAFKLGHIFALCLLESANHNISFFEYASRYIKKAVTFSGQSDKKLVQQFIINFFSLSTTQHLDATDALAVALCHSQELKKNSIQEKIARIQA